MTWAIGPSYWLHVSIGATLGVILSTHLLLRRGRPWNSYLRNDLIARGLGWGFCGFIVGQILWAYVDFWWQRGRGLI